MAELDGQFNYLGAPTRNHSSSRFTQAVTTAATTAAGFIVAEVPDFGPSYFAERLTRPAVCRRLMRPQLSRKAVRKEKSTPASSQLVATKTQLPHLRINP
jgi:hypothetical protein